MKFNMFSYLSAIAVFAMCFASCSQDELDGPQGDTIKLSTRVAEFGDDLSPITIMTGGDGWWIEGVEIDGKHHYPDYVTASYHREFMMLTIDWLTVERVDGNTIRLTAANNPYNTERSAVIVLEDRNYFDYITVTQGCATPSDVKLLPSVIISVTGSVGSLEPSLSRQSRFTYDGQNRIESITQQTEYLGTDIDTPVWVSTIVYDGDAITVTTESSMESNPEYVPVTTVTKYEVVGGKVYKNDADPIDLDGEGRALIYEYEYDGKGNITSHSQWGNKHVTVTYDYKNGVFRHVNMPSWFLTAYLNVIPYANMFIYNNAVVAWHTETLGWEKPAGEGYTISFNEYDYPVSVGSNLINITSNGHSYFTVEYVGAQ